MKDSIFDDKLSALRVKLKTSQNILIFTHTFLDPDALGSMLALADLIGIWKSKNVTETDRNDQSGHRLDNIGRTNNRLQITPIIFEQPMEYEQLPHYVDISHLFIVQTDEDISNVAQKIEEADLIFIVDTASYNRAVKGEKLVNLLRRNQDKIVIIDHHKTPTTANPFLLFKTIAASCAQLIYEMFVKILKAGLSTQSSIAILYGILGDTRMLRYLPNTEFYVAGYIEDILSYLNKELPGKILTDIAEALDLKLDLVSIPVFQEMVKNLRIKQGIAGTYISKAYGLNAQQLNIARLFMLYSVLSKIKEVKIYFTVRPDLEKKGIFIGSLRSKGNIDVSKIAQKYNGGGHKNAAGCDVKAESAKQAFEILFEELEELAK